MFEFVQKNNNFRVFVILGFIKLFYFVIQNKTKPEKTKSRVFFPEPNRKISNQSVKTNSKHDDIHYIINTICFEFFMQSLERNINH